MTALMVASVVGGRSAPYSVRIARRQAFGTKAISDAYR